MKYHKSWDSGEGARLYGGRWNSVGRRIVYCDLDPATTVLEVAVHKGFRVLDTVPHVLTSLRVKDPTTVQVVSPAMIPNANRLRPGMPGAGQQMLGDDLLGTHPFVVIPSVVSSRSWNLLFDRDVATGQHSLMDQEHFTLDTRLHPPSVT